MAQAAAIEGYSTPAAETEQEFAIGGLALIRRYIAIRTPDQMDWEPPAEVRDDLLHGTVLSLPNSRIGVHELLWTRDDNDNTVEHQIPYARVYHIGQVTLLASNGKTINRPRANLIFDPESQIHSIEPTDKSLAALL